MAATQKDFRLLALIISSVQLTVAVAAVTASANNPISDLACLGGVFGTLVNVIILAITLPWALILAFKSWKKNPKPPGLTYLSMVCGTSLLAIWIGSGGALRCTV